MCWKSVLCVKLCRIDFEDQEILGSSWYSKSSCWQRSRDEVAEEEVAVDKAADNEVADNNETVDSKAADKVADDKFYQAVSNE